MTERLRDKDLSALEYWLGQQTWKRVQRAAWRGDSLEDGLLSAVACEVACRAYRTMRWQIITWGCILVVAASFYVPRPSGTMS